MEKVQVNDIMTADPESIPWDASLREAVYKMGTRNCRHLPVIRNKEVIGLISDRDLRGYVLPFDNLESSSDVFLSRLEESVSELTQSDLISIGREDSLQEAIELMLENDIGALPVVEPAEGRLVGIVSYIDVLRAFYERLE